MSALMPEGFTTETFPEPPQGKVKEDMLRAHKMPLTRTAAGSRTLDKTAQTDMQRKQQNVYYQVYESEMDEYFNAENELRQYMHLEPFLYGTHYKPLIHLAVRDHQERTHDLISRTRRFGQLLALCEFDPDARLMLVHKLPLKECLAIAEAGNVENVLQQLDYVDKDQVFETWADKMSTSRMGFDKQHARLLIKDFITRTGKRHPIVDITVTMANKQRMEEDYERVREAHNTPATEKLADE